MNRPIPPARTRTFLAGVLAIALAGTLAADRPALADGRSGARPAGDARERWDSRYPGDGRSRRGLDRDGVGQGAEQDGGPTDHEAPNPDLTFDDFMLERGVAIIDPDGESPHAAQQDDPIEPPCEGNNFANDNHFDVLTAAGPLLGITWVPDASVTVTRIEIYTGEIEAPNALAIWSDNGGSPSHPLAPLGFTSTFQTILPKDWQGADLLTPVPVTAGEKYWVVWDPNGGEQASASDDVADIQQDYWTSVTGNVTGGATWEGPFTETFIRWKFRMFCGDVLACCEPCQLSALLAPLAPGQGLVSTDPCFDTMVPTPPSEACCDALETIVPLLPGSPSIPATHPCFAPEGLGTPCAGFANFSCPDGLACLDDEPGDDCNLDCGGADCPGICVIAPEPPIPCTGGVACPVGMTCVDIPNDGCSDECGGVDCPSTCVIF